MHTGAQVVLRKSANKEGISKRVEDTIMEFANRGYRALGITIAEGGEGVRPALLLLLLLLHAAAACCCCCCCLLLLGCCCKRTCDQWHPHLPCSACFASNCCMLLLLAPEHGYGQAAALQPKCELPGAVLAPACTRNASVTPGTRF